MSESEMLMGGDNTSQASPISSATLYALAQFAFLCAILAICIAIFLNVRNGEQTYLVSNVIYTATACPSVVDFEPSEIVNVTLCPGVVPLVDLNAVRARDLGESQFHCTSFPLLDLFSHEIQLIGVPFSGSNPGQWNAITDVTGVTVGHSTIVCGCASSEFVIFFVSTTDSGNPQGRSSGCRKRTDKNRRHRCTASGHGWEVCKSFRIVSERMASMIMTLLPCPQASAGGVLL